MENICLSWLISLSDEFQNVRYANPPAAGAHTLTPNLIVSTLLEGRVQLKRTHSSPTSRKKKKKKNLPQAEKPKKKESFHDNEAQRRRIKQMRQKEARPKSDKNFLLFQ